MSNAARMLTRACRPRAGTSRTQKVDAEDDQRGADREQEGVARDAAGDEAADACSDHGRRRHPGEEPPVDASGPNVLDRGGERRDHRAPGTDEGSGERGDEAPECDRYEQEDVQPVEYPR